ncbi:hypothetical protein VCHC33A2_2229, partial [Vibrio cholerae HC-33A2]
MAELVDALASGVSVL